MPPLRSCGALLLLREMMKLWASHLRLLQLLLILGGHWRLRTNMFSQCNQTSKFSKSFSQMLKFTAFSVSWRLEFTVFRVHRRVKYAIRDTSHPLSTHSKWHDKFRRACLITWKTVITGKMKFCDFISRRAMHYMILNNSFVTYSSYSRPRDKSCMPSLPPTHRICPIPARSSTLAFPELARQSSTTRELSCKLALATTKPHRSGPPGYRASTFPLLHPYSSLHPLRYSVFVHCSCPSSWATMW